MLKRDVFLMQDNQMTTTDHHTDPTYLALLARICETPVDDAPRLIASDRLEELGEDERAEFIRVQIRIAGLQSHCSCGSCVKLRGGGQCTNGPCAVDRERDELLDGRSKQAFLRIREDELFQLLSNQGKI